MENKVVTLLRKEPLPGEIRFFTNDQVVLQINPDGTFLVHGKKIVDDVEVYLALSEFLVSNGWTPSKKSTLMRFLYTLSKHKMIAVIGGLIAGIGFAILSFIGTYWALAEPLGK